VRGESAQLDPWTILSSTALVVLPILPALVVLAPLSRSRFVRLRRSSYQVGEFLWTEAQKSKRVWYGWVSSSWCGSGRGARRR